MIAIIAAMSKNHVIGDKGKIPWKIKGEQKRFKELTTGNTVIMGKRSYEEIGRPLPNRKTIIISSTMAYEDENCRTARSLEEGLKLAGDSEAIQYGNRLIMMYEGKVIFDISGEAKKKLQVSDLLEKFKMVSGDEFANDRMILS